MSAKTKPLRDLFTKMINDKLTTIERLRELEGMGLKIGTPTVADFIKQEEAAINNLERSIAFMDHHE